MFNLFKKQKPIDQKRAEIMDAIRKANGQAIILGETPEGTRIIVLGKVSEEKRIALIKPLYQRQIEDILKSKEV